MSEKAEAVQQEHSAAVRRKGGAKRHCARFWWLYLIIFIVVVLLVVLLIIFVGLPKIAQQKIDAAELTIQGITVAQTQSQNYTMAINSTIRTDGSVHATVDAFTGVMYLEDLQPHTPFATVDFPQTTADALQIVNITQFMPITDMAAFTTFNTWLLANDSLRVTVSGNTNVHVSGISKAYGVAFTKTITMPGLRNFEGINVTNAVVSLQPDANGDNFKGFVQVPNYSLVTFEIGNATFYNYLLGKEIGTTTMDNMILRPGNSNNFSMHANVSAGDVLTALGKKPYCETGLLPFVLRGKNVTNNGQHLSYYADALAANNQTTQINIAEPLKALNITASCNT